MYVKDTYKLKCSTCTYTNSHKIYANAIQIKQFKNVEKYTVFDIEKSGLFFFTF